MSVAFRIQTTRGGDWVFVCRVCMEASRQENPDYRYGGTWKGKRH